MNNYKTGEAVPESDSIYTAPEAYEIDTLIEENEKLIALVAAFTALGSRIADLERALEHKEK